MLLKKKKKNMRKTYFRIFIETFFSWIERNDGDLEPGRPPMTQEPGEQIQLRNDGPIVIGDDDGNAQYRHVAPLLGDAAVLDPGPPPDFGPVAGPTATPGLEQVFDAALAPDALLLLEVALEPQFIEEAPALDGAQLPDDLEGF